MYISQLFKGKLLILSLTLSLYFFPQLLVQAQQTEKNLEGIERLIPKIRGINSTGYSDEEGAGIILSGTDKEMIILTAYHVIENAEEIQVVLFRYAKKFKANVLKVDEDLDLALLEISGPFPSWNIGLPPASKQDLEVGQNVVTVGHPVGNEWDINPINQVKSNRIVTDRRRFTITSSGITSGSSGGPVFSKEGYWLGMVTETNQVSTVCVKTVTIQDLVDYWGYREYGEIDLRKRSEIKAEASGIKARLTELLSCFESEVRKDLKDQYGPYLLSSWQGTKKMFIAGIRGILYYANLGECFSYMSQEKLYDFYDYRPIEAVAGMKAFLKDQKEDASLPFSFANPEIVKWGYTNLIPDPDTYVLGESCQAHYDQRYKRFFRLMAASYVHMNNQMNISTEVDWYKRNLYSDPNYNGLSLLDQRYGAIMPEYDAYGTDIYNPWHSSYSFGFWVRRNIDGSDKELWKGLSKLLNTYDKAFLKELMRE
ncbi:MAG: serine protease [Bacteroidota bacterium]